jgi:Flp pilus assembly protein TadG
MARPLTRLLRRLRRDTAGAGAIEFAMMLPVLVLLLFGVVEVGRYIYLNMKLQNASGNVADIVSRPDQVNAADIQNLFAAAPTLMAPFDAAGRLRIIVSGVIVPGPNDPPEVAWQADSQTGPDAGSAIGAVGQTASVPEGLVYNGGEALIVAEVFYDYDPWLFGLAGDRRLDKVSYFRPRRGTLASLN